VLEEALGFSAASQLEILCLVEFVSSEKGYLVTTTAESHHFGSAGGGRGAFKSLEQSEILCFHLHAEMDKTLECSMTENSHRQLKRAGAVSL